MTYADVGDFDAAIRDYNDTIELSPEDADAYYNRGNAYLAKDNFDAAIRDYNDTIELSPEDADAYNNRGVAYADIGDLDAAIRDYNDAIALNPELYRCLLQSWRGVAAPKRMGESQDRPNDC